MAKKIDANVNVNLLVMQEFDSAEQSYNAALAKWNELKSRIRDANKSEPDEALMARIRDDFNGFIDTLGLSVRSKREVNNAIKLDEFKIDTNDDLSDVPEEVKERALEGWVSSSWNSIQVWEKLNEWIEREDCSNELREVLTEQDFRRLSTYLEHRADPTAAVAASKGREKFPASEQGRTWISATIKGHEVRFRRYGDAWGLRGLGAVEPREATGLTTAELVQWAAEHLPKPI